MAEVLELGAERRTIEADVNFCGELDYKPHATLGSKEGGNSATERLDQLKIVAHRVSIEDGSSAAPDLDLDRNGFVHLHHPSKVTDFKDVAQIKGVYRAEIRALLTSLVHPDIIEFPENAGAYRASQAGLDENKTALMAHLDFTEKGAHHAVDQEFSNRQKDVRRWAYIKIWRALSPVAPVDVPFALLDSQTLSEKDIVLVDTEYRHIPGVTESAALHYSPEQRWIYFSQMKRDDIIIFKNYDSDPTKNFMAGHTAFVDTSAPADAAPRSSYEIRAYAGWF